MRTDGDAPWGAEHNRIVHDILRDHGSKSLIKSKSMLTEECGLRHYMASGRRRHGARPLSRFVIYNGLNALGKAPRGAACAQADLSQLVPGNRGGKR